MSSTTIVFWGNYHLEIIKFGNRYVGKAIYIDSRDNWFIEAYEAGPTLEAVEAKLKESLSNKPTTRG